MRVRALKALLHFIDQSGERRTKIAELAKLTNQKQLDKYILVN